MATSPVIADIDFAGKGKRFGHLRVPQSRNDHGWGSIPVPIVVIANGTGPTVMLTAGNHGDEYEGQVALLDLARTLDPARVQGRVILLPAMHFPAAMNGTRLSPLDNRDFNRSFPGEPFGTFALVLAHFVDSVLLPMCDFQMDLHSGGTGMDIMCSAVGHVLEDKALEAKALAMADAFGAPITLVLAELNAGPTLLAAAERRGIVALSSELGGAGRLNPENYRITRRGAENVLRHAGVLEGKPVHDAQPRRMTVPGMHCYVFAPEAGIYQADHVLGDEVKAGQRAGRLHFIQDPARPPLELVYGADGVLWCTRHAGRINAGDPVAVIANDL
jgi:N-alpha-acetyl-L-2,4-diaminobutyrate deacetylase